MKILKLIFLLICISYGNDIWGKSKFKENLIWPSIYKNPDIGLTYPFGLRLSDINNDKNLDLVHCNITRENKRNLLISECYIHYGLGNGKFSTEKIFKRLGLLERLYSINFDYGEVEEYL